MKNKSIANTIKIILVFTILFIPAVLIVACSPDNVNIEVAESVTTIVDNELLDEYGVDEMFLVTISIRQSHAWWQFIDRWRDNINAEEIVIPVMQEWFNTVEIGKMLEDSFRWGSFWLSDGSIGNWQIQIVDKQIVVRG